MPSIYSQNEFKSIFVISLKENMGQNEVFFQRMLKYKELSKNYEQQGNLSEAYKHLKKYLNIRDSLFLSIHKPELVEKEKGVDNYFYALCVLFMIISSLALMLFLGYRNYRLVFLKKNLELENIKLKEKIEQERNNFLQAELALVERNLSIKTLQLCEKNDGFVLIRKELEKDEKLDKKLNKIINYNINIEEDWIDFKKHFEEVHPKFFISLKSKYEKLTQNDLRHCAYIRIGLENKQIAQIMNINVESLKMSRNRLRKKMNLPQEADLAKILLNI